VHEWLNQKAIIERGVDPEMDNRSDENVLTQTIELAEHEVMEAIIHYMLQKYGNGRVTAVEWLIAPEEGNKLPPIKSISARCTVELR
jgi:hypothetical protein